MKSALDSIPKEIYHGEGPVDAQSGSNVSTANGEGSRTE